jgi:hypothetical protein
VTTIAGDGRQGRVAWPGLEQLAAGDPLPERWVGKPRQTALNSPWAVWVHDDDLYIAMAGPHQIWKMPLDESEIGPYAGNGREDIVDGPLLPRRPYESGYASFAQPSGLASDGKDLFVADSEGSSIRAVPFDPAAQVRTVVGTADKPLNRLFIFGDQDGPVEQALLQHALGIVFHDNQLYIADTYNNKIKRIDLAEGVITTISGTGDPGREDDPAQFDEPAGISYAAGKLYLADTNNHAIRTIDLDASYRVRTLAIAGLASPQTTPPTPTRPKRRPSFPGAKQIKLPPQTVRTVDGKLALSIELSLPKGWKINSAAPMGYLVELITDDGPVDRSAAGEYVRVTAPAAKVVIPLPAGPAGKETVKVSLNYYHCQESDDGVCKTGAVIWTLPVQVAEGAEAEKAVLKHEIDVNE